MWFEILPSFAIITGALALPGYALYGLHKLTLGNVSAIFAAATESSLCSAVF